MMFTPIADRQTTKIVVYIYIHLAFYLYIMYQFMLKGYWTTSASSPDFFQKC